MDKDFRLLRLLKASEEGLVDEDMRTWDPFLYISSWAPQKKERKKEKEKKKL